jgi:hypothetical protein
VSTSVLGARGEIRGKRAIWFPLAFGESSHYRPPCCAATRLALPGAVFLGSFPPN